MHRDMTFCIKVEMTLGGSDYIWCAFVPWAHACKIPDSLNGYFSRQRRYTGFFSLFLQPPIHSLALLSELSSASYQWMMGRCLYKYKRKCPPELQYL